MRIRTELKFNRLRGPINPNRLSEIEAWESERKNVEADAILAADGEGLLYWVDIMPTTDGGSARVYDNTSATYGTLAAGYAAKALDGQLKLFDPPKVYKHGIYVNLTTAVVEICYRPYARNLRCTIDVGYAPGTHALVSRLISLVESQKDFVSQLTVRQESTKDFVMRVVIRAKSSKDLVDRLTVLRETSKDLDMRLTVAYATVSLDLVSRLVVRQETENNMVSRVTVTSTKVTSDVVSRVTVRKEGTSNLVSRLYADQTP